MKTEHYAKVQELLARKEPFAIATVIAVTGSASAKVGSKAIIDGRGQNILGWVGGGCAESFTGSQAVEAMTERQPRIIEADLDDEIFGLGMPCGGKMRIYIEPQLPPEILSLPDKTAPRALLETLSIAMGFEPVFDQKPIHLPALAEAERGIYVLARTILEKRNLAWASLREVKGVYPASDSEEKFSRGRLLILGNSRITEELAKLAAIVAWPTHVIGPGIARGIYPAGISVEEVASAYANVNPNSDDFVVVASHHKGDHEFIEKALGAGASYIGLVASAKRSGLVLDFLREKGVAVSKLARVFAPAGIQLNCINPSEIALSIFAEMIALHREILA